MVCKNCETEVIQNYCPNCGTPVVLKRINGQYILKEISSVLNFDRGILYTIRELLLRPGKNIQTFVLEDRNRLVKPIIFIIITSLIYKLAQQFLHFEDGYVNAGGFEESATTNIFGWIQKNYGYANIIMAIFIAGWIKVFFRKYEYNFDTSVYNKNTKFDLYDDNDYEEVIEYTSHFYNILSGSPDKEEVSKKDNIIYILDSLR